MSRMSENEIFNILWSFYRPTQNMNMIKINIRKCLAYA
jgi:hypothetical protein